MMSKKQLNSDELDSLRRSRNPTEVLTASGEVHTNEEWQVFDHDLNRFVTVQLLEETLAILSIGKLCDGNSCEMVSGQKPRLTKDGHTIMCKTDNFVPLGVPSLFFGAVRRQHRHRRICLQQVQLQSEVTNQRHESGADHSQNTTRKKEGWQSRFGQPFARSS